MSFSNASIELPRPAAYARVHRSGPRRARTSRSASSLRSSNDLSTTVTPVRSVTASRAPRIRAARVSSPWSTAAAARGPRAYTNANLSRSSRICVRLSRTTAIASSAFPRRTARMARTYSAKDKNNGAPCRSTIHVEDCARALVHLAEHGEPSGRYFVVNRDPIRLHEFAGTFARLANRPLRAFRVPTAAIRLVVGSVLADHLQADAVFSNIRLRGIGFRFLYPTLDQGLQQVIGALHE